VPGAAQRIGERRRDARGGSAEVRDEHGAVIDQPVTLSPSASERAIA
jgi:hypothetical protein